MKKSPVDFPLVLDENFLYIMVIPFLCLRGLTVKSITFRPSKEALVKILRAMKEKGFEFETDAINYLIERE